MTISLEEAINKAINVAARGVTGKYIIALQEELKYIFLTDVASALKAAFLEAYDRLAEVEESQFGPAIRTADHSSLRTWRHLFEAQIDKELADSISVGSEGIDISVGNLTLFGKGQTHKGREDAPTTVDWLIYYIEGVAGEFAFITESQYREMRGRWPSEGIGRFGTGFLIPKESYVKERWEKGTGKTFDDVRHPISGQPPYREFEKIPQKIDFAYYVTLAAERAGKKLEQRFG